MLILKQCCISDTAFAYTWPRDCKSPSGWLSYPHTQHVMYFYLVFTRQSKHC